MAAHRQGPMLVRGRAGSGRSEALAARLAALAADGVPAERVLVLTRSRAAAARLRARAEELLAEPYEELWIATYDDASPSGCLRDYAVEAGLDPFFETVGPADRLAILLDRVDELPLRRHEIRGNPAGLLARLLRRIDALKAEGVARPAADLGRGAGAGAPSAAAERERARREIEFADLYARHERDPARRRQPRRRRPRARAATAAPRRARRRRAPRSRGASRT